MIPSVAVNPNPAGLPRATIFSPTFSLSEFVNVNLLNEPFTFKTAISNFLSEPFTRAK